MNTEQTQDLRPLEYAGILDRTVELYKNNVALLLGIVAVVYIPLAIIQVAGAQMIPSAVVTTGSSVSFSFSLGSAAGLWFLGMTLLNATAPFVVIGAMIFAVSNLLLGRPTTIAQAYGGALAVAAPLIGTGLLCGVLIAIGVMMCVIPGLVIALMSVFVSETVVLERKSYMAAFSRSKDLVMGQGQWVRVIVLGIVLMLLLGVVSWAAMAGVRTFTPATQIGSIIWMFTGSLVQVALMPFGLIASMLLYFDIRHRFEGYSLQGLAMELAGQPAPVRVPEAWNAASGAPPPWEQQQGAPPVSPSGSGAPPAAWGAPPQAPPPPPPQAWGGGQAPAPPQNWGTGQAAAPPQNWGGGQAAAPPQWGAPPPPPAQQQQWAPPAGNAQWAAPPPPPPQGVPTQAPQAARVCVQCGSPVTTQFCMQCGSRQPG